MESVGGKELDTDEPFLVCRVVGPPERPKENDLDVVFTHGDKALKEVAISQRLSAPGEEKP